MYYFFLNAACGDCFVKGFDLYNSTLYKLRGKIHTSSKFRSDLDYIPT